MVYGLLQVVLWQRFRAEQWWVGLLSPLALTLQGSCQLAVWSPRPPHLLYFLYEAHGGQIGAAGGMGTPLECRLAKDTQTGQKLGRQQSNKGSKAV